MIGGLNHVTLAVSDLERSFAFYRDVLGFRPLARWKRGAYLIAGEETWICLALDPSVRTAPVHGYTHLAFSVSQPDFAAAVERIRAAGAAEWKENSSEGDSLYFLDPTGHKLELHVGDWRSRLAACRERPFDDMVFLEPSTSDLPATSLPHSNARPPEER